MLLIHTHRHTQTPKPRKLLILKCCLLCTKYFKTCYNYSNVAIKKLLTKILVEAVILVFLKRFQYSVNVRSAAK